MVEPSGLIEACAYRILFSPQCLGDIGELTGTISSL